MSSGSTVAAANVGLADSVGLALSERMKMSVLTADTFSKAGQECAGPPVLPKLVVDVSAAPMKAPTIEVITAVVVRTCS